MLKHDLTIVSKGKDRNRRRIMRRRVSVLLSLAASTAALPYAPELTQTYSGMILALGIITADAWFAYLWVELAIRRYVLSGKKRASEG